MKSKIHLIIAHPNSSSFNYALADQAELVAKEHSCQISSTDLYQLARSQDPCVDFYGLNSSQQPIEQEQQKFQSADLLILQFPMYWFSYPAVMQAYFEQIWQPGFAYPPTFENSPLANENKKILFSITTQSPLSAYTNQGKNGDMKRILFPITTAFRFIGCSILEPFICYAISEQDEEQRSQVLSDYQAHITNMLLEPKIIMRPSSTDYL